MKTKVLYLHGWGGDCNSSLGRIIEEKLDPDKYEVIRPSICLEDPDLAYNQILHNIVEADIVIANSTSGLYASKIMETYNCAKFILINPLVNNRELLGINVDKVIVDRMDYLTTKGKLNSSARYDIFVSTDDEVLDSSLCIGKYYNITLIKDSHSIKNEKSINKIMQSINNLNNQFNMRLE